MLPSTTEYKGAAMKWAKSLEAAKTTNAILGIKNNGEHIWLIATHYATLKEMELADARKMSKQEIYAVTEKLLKNEGNRYVKALTKQRLEELKDERLENYTRKVMKVFCLCTTPFIHQQNAITIKNKQLLEDFLSLNSDDGRINKTVNLHDEINNLKRSMRVSKDELIKSETLKIIGTLKSEYKKLEDEIVNILSEVSKNKEVLRETSLIQLISVLKPLFCNFSKLEKTFTSFYQEKAFIERLEQADFLHSQETEELKFFFEGTKMLTLLKNEDALIDLLDQAINLTKNDIFNELYHATENRMSELVSLLPEDAFYEALDSDDFRPETVGEKTGLYRSASSIFKAVQKDKNIKIATII